ncbi:MAG: domain S-box-containing protein/diguanylate cyclase (GGDEF)-like protein, partial [Actinomycetota bacterium]|nr:domain S-box-containing protein/diguanylate cyclase (GGDEF)-like protein [Actinomycetota bacterium]
MKRGRVRWADRLLAWTRVDADQPLLPVVRRAFLVFLLTCYGIMAVQWLSDPLVPPHRSWPILPVLAALACSGIRLYRTGHRHPVTDLLVAVGVGIVIWAVGALPAGGVLFVGASFRALYGRLPSTLVSCVLVIIAMTGGVIAAGGTLADVKLVQYGPGLVLTTVMLWLVLVAVQRYETGAAARFEVVVRSSRDVILITDADTVAGFVSPALEQVFGLAPDALPGNRILSWVVPQDRDLVGQRV